MQNLYKGGQVVTPSGNLEYTYPLFDTFWNNVGANGSAGLRAQLFPGSLATQRSIALQDFKNLVYLINDENNLIYKFIIVK